MLGVFDAHSLAISGFLAYIKRIWASDLNGTSPTKCYCLQKSSRLYQF
jgi:hypothetical protein